MCIPSFVKGVFLIIYSAKKRYWAFVLSFFLLSSSVCSAFADTLGPVSSFEELSSLAASASEGDTILITGEILASDEPALSTHSAIRILSEQGAVIHGLRLENASVSFSGISLVESLRISGTSNVQLGSGVRVTGSAGHEGISFRGNGTLIIEPGCQVTGGQSSSGLSISHNGGEFYGSIEGSVRGGSGFSGGAGVVISPLLDNGAVMITGSIHGGSGEAIGGHALNLYDLSGNAYITVDASLQGSGSIGGDGIQLVSVQDNVNVGISGRVKGGDGDSYGGNALILMNAEDSSSFHISGHFSGGNATGENALPGTSLHLVGDSASMLYLKLEDAKKENSALTKEIKAQIKTVKKEKEAVLKEQKAEMDVHARFNQAAKPFLDAEKIFKEKENFTHLEEISAEYEEAKIRVEAERAAQLAEQKRLDEEKAAQKAAIKAEKEAAKAAKGKK